MRFGPGAAVALSMAPVLAIFILMLARFMRGGIERDTKQTGVDRVFGVVGTVLRLLLSAAALAVQPRAFVV